MTTVETFLAWLPVTLFVAAVYVFYVFIEILKSHLIASPALPDPDSRLPRFAYPTETRTVTKFDIPLLTKYNFAKWRRFVFIALDLEGITEDSLRDASPDSRLNNLALMRIEKSIPSQLNPRTFSAWGKIMELENKLGSNNHARRRELEMQITKGTQLVKFDLPSVENHLEKVKELLDCLEDSGADLCEQERNVFLAKTLPTTGIWKDEYDRVAHMLTWNQATFSIKQFCIDHLQSGSEAREFIGFSQGQSRRRPTDDARAKRREQDVKDGTCFYCHSKEHRINDCPDRPDRFKRESRLNKDSTD